MMLCPAGRNASAPPHVLPASLCRFDFANSNINDENLNKMNPHHVPDVVSLSVTSGKHPQPY